MLNLNLPGCSTTKKPPPPPHASISVYECAWAYIDDSWAVGAYEAGGALAQQLMFDPHHVLLGDALSDAHHQRDLCVDGFDDGCCRERRGYINHAGICPCALLCLRRGIEVYSRWCIQNGNSKSYEIVPPNVSLKIICKASQDICRIHPKFKKKRDKQRYIKRSHTYLLDWIEDWQAQVCLATLAGGHTSN